MKKLTAALAITLCAAAALTSCIDSGKKSNYKVSQAYTGYFNEIIDETTTDIDLYGGVSYNVEWDLTDNVANVQIIGLKLPDGSTFPTLQFNEVPWKINERGWQEIRIMDMQPAGVGSYGQVPLFRTFLFQTVNRVIQGNYVPCVNISYSIDNNYRIYSLPEQILEVGETTVVDGSTGETYKPDVNTDPAYYLVQIDAVKKLATITITGAKFAKNMPAMNLRFPNIPFETTLGGDIKLYSEHLIPSMLTGSSISSATETPMPAFPITNLGLTYDPDKGISVSFTCTMTTDKISGVYHVTMINQYPEKIQ